MSLIGRGVRGIFHLPPSLLRRLAGPPRRSPEGYELDLQTQLLLRFLQTQPELHQLGVERLRRRMNQDAPLLDLVTPGVPSSDGEAAGCPIRIYTPEGAKGLLIYFHGGGWVIGSIASHDGVCRALAKRVGAVVVSVEYRLGPEHRFPAAPNDAVAAARALCDRFATQPVAVAGDSAGGSLAATVALQLRDRIAMQLLIYPSTDLTREHASHQHFRDGYLLTKASMDWFLSHYVSPDQLRDPLGSPLHVEDLRGAPRACVMTAGFDPLRDEGHAYAERLRQAGVAVDYRLYPCLIHGFFSMAGAIHAAARAFDDAVEFLSAGFRARS